MRERTIHCHVKRWTQFSRKDRKPGFQRGEPPGKRKTQTIQRPEGKRRAMSLDKWSKLDLHKAAKNKQALSYLFQGVFMAAEQAT